MRTRYQLSHLPPVNDLLAEIGPLLKQLVGTITIAIVLTYKQEVSLRLSLESNTQLHIRDKKEIIIIIIIRTHSRRWTIVLSMPHDRQPLSRPLAR